MNLGTAIRTLRKHKGLTQKEVSDATGLTVNALSLIETNVTFPQKSTIKAICNALEVPESYLLFFALDEADVSDVNRVTFNSLSKALRSVILDDIKKVQE